MNVDRSAALSAAAAWFDAGGLLQELASRVGIRTESQNPECAPALARYLTEEIGPVFYRLCFRTEIWDNPVGGAPPMPWPFRLLPSWPRTGGRTRRALRRAPAP